MQNSNLRLNRLEKATKRGFNGGYLLAFVRRNDAGIYTAACELWSGKHLHGKRQGDRLCICTEHQTEQDALTAARVLAEKHRVKKAVTLYGDYDMPD